MAPGNDEPNNLPTQEELDQQHKEVTQTRRLRDELLKVECLIEGALKQVTAAYESCGDIPHLKDTKENIMIIGQLIQKHPLHKLYNIQLSVDRMSAYT